MQSNSLNLAGFSERGCYNQIMADLDKRLARDVVVISNHLIQNLGLDKDDFEISATTELIIEPEVVSEAIRQDYLTGANAIIVNPIQFHASSLRKTNSLERATELAKTVCKCFSPFKIAHPLISVKQTSLPLDEASKTSLLEISNDYKFIGELFNTLPIDGFYMEGFTNPVQLKCALIGLRKSTDKTILIDNSARILESDFNEYDYYPCSSHVSVLDFAQLKKTDTILGAGEKSVSTGNQFIAVKNGKPAQTAGLVALLQGISL